MKAFFQAYLFAFLYWVDLPLGVLPFLMIYALTGGAWGNRLAPFFDAAADLLLIFAILSIPILLGIHEIYPWVDPKIALEPKIAHKAIYLNPGMFAGRTILYFVGWLALRKMVAARNEFSGAGLAVFGLTITFASID